MSQKATSIIKTFIHDLNSDLDDYKKLHQLLKLQHHNMIQRNSDKLTKITDKHQNTLQLLQQRADQRSNLLEQLGMDGSADSVNRLIKALPKQHSQNTQAKWTLLKQLVNECMMQNERNSRLLMMQQQILTQVLHQDNDSTYQPVGY
ncbi:flagellar export chaperone FlgN [Photobacterium minamisatsumaniensis]|uniref:flagellar export chaperone FlgN n=1 Tax=Photobacterium minamisatsumaniensis TaxID=2910233 RepID=UPI003D0A7FE0